MKWFFGIWVPLSLFGATWNTNINNSDWNVNGNWTAPATFPNAIDAEANFLTVITANRNVRLGQDITVGTINIDDNNRYTILTVAADTLTFEVSSGTASLTVTNTNGNGPHRIQAPMIFASTLTMTHSSNAVIRLQGDISGAGGLIKEGSGSGQLRISGTNTYTGTTTINEGTVRYDSDSAIPGGSTVTVGDGVSTARLIINADMSAVNAFPLVVNTSGTLDQNNGDIMRILSLSGSGDFEKSTGGGNQNFVDIIGSTSTTFSGILSGGATNASTNPNAGNRFLKSGTSTLTLTGTNTYISRTFVQDGVLNVQNGSALGATGSSSAAYVRAGGTLEIENNINLTKTVLINGTGFSSGGAIHNVADTNTITGTMTVGWSGGPEAAAAATIQVDGGTSLSIDGMITGGSDLTLSGSGTLTFTGGIANDYTGDTIVSDGTLDLDKTGVNAVVGDIDITGGTLFLSQADQIGNGSDVTLDSGSFNMNSNADTINSLTFNGGTLSQGGATLDLASLVTPLTMRDTTIAGNLTLSGGTVTFDATNDGTAAISGNIDQGAGTVDYAVADGTASTDMLISGIISNGTLTKSDAGTLELTGANTYGGGTTVSAGTLRGNATSLQGDIANAGTLIFNQGTDGSYGGSITGAGSLTKEGSGTLTLTGINSVGSPTSVSAGTLRVNGSLAGAGSLSVSPGATLEGDGVISKSISVSGTLAPGGSIGTTVVIGDITFLGGSTLEIELNSVATDLVDVTGSVTIDPGATLAIVPDAGTVPLSQYLIVDTTGGVTGTFTTVTNSFPFINFQVSYTADQILLLAELVGANFPIFSGNAGKVARCFNSFTLLPGSDIADVAMQLSNLPSSSKLEEALLQLQPSAFTALALVQENNVLEVRNAIYQHMEATSTPCQEKSLCSRAHLWIAGLNEWSWQNNDGTEPGYRATSPGVVIGSDAILGDSGNVGAAVGYTHSSLDWKRNRGSAVVNSFYFSLYGQYTHSRGFLMASIIESLQHFNENRKIKFGTIGRTARSNHNGIEGGAHLKGGLFFHKNRLTFAPFAKLDYLYLYEERYNESGAGVLNLEVDKKKSDLLVTGVGLRTSSCITTQLSKFAPYLSLAAIWENRFRGDKISADFNGCSLNVKGLNPSRWLFEYAVGVHYHHLVKRIQASFSCKGRYSDHFFDTSLYLELGTCF